MALAWTLTGGALRFEATSAYENRISLSSSQNNITVDIQTPLTIDENAVTGNVESVFSTGNSSGQSLTLAGGLSRAPGAQRSHRFLIMPNTASSGTANLITLAGVIGNGGSATGSVAVELGCRAPTSSNGRLESRVAHTYTGDTRIGAGVIVAYVDAPVSSTGAFGNASSVLSLGYDQVAATASVALLTNGPITIARPINFSNGAGPNSTFAVTLGGESAHASLFTGAIDLDGTLARTTKVSLTAASGGVVTFSGVLSHGTAGSAVPIEKVGPGTVILSAANTYTGGTTVSAGNLLANNTTGSATGTGTITVANGAALGGTGAVSGAVTLQAGGGLAFQLSTLPGSHDKLDLASSLTFAGASTVTVTSSNSSPTPGTYTLLTAAGGITGALPTLILPSNWTGSLAISGNDLRLTVTATSALESWRQAHFASWQNSGNASNDADPDRDGLTNLLEYALGGNPASSANSPAPVVGTVRSGGTFLTLTFNRGRADVTYLVEGSSDFSTWSTVALNPGSVGQSVTVTDAVNVASGERRLLRLRVTSP